MDYKIGVKPDKSIVLHLHLFSKILPIRDKQGFELDLEYLVLLGHKLMLGISLTYSKRSGCPCSCSLAEHVAVELLMEGLSPQGLS